MFKLNVYEPGISFCDQTVNNSAIFIVIVVILWLMT